MEGSKVMDLIPNKITQYYGDVLLLLDKEENRRKPISELDEVTRRKVEILSDFGIEITDSPSGFGHEARFDRLQKKAQKIFDLEEGSFYYNNLKNKENDTQEQKD